MPRVNYAIPVDVLRQYDSSIEESDIGATPTGGLNVNEVFPFTEDTMLSEIETAEAEFERRATKLTDQTVENELHEGTRRASGWSIYLDNEDIKPLDSNAGDKVEIRTGPDQDDWRDVTDDVFLDERMGVIEINRQVFIRTPFYPVDTNYRFRVTYRYGTDTEEGGETTLTSSVADTETVPFDLDVDDASEIEANSVVLIGATEYVYIDSVDEGADTLKVGERAIRGTSASSHATGDVVNRIPLNIRDAIAAKAAVTFFRQDDFTDVLIENGSDNISNETKIEQLEEKFDNAIGLYGGNYHYV